MASWARKFAAQFVHPDDVVLDVGCGILDWCDGKPLARRYLGVDAFRPYLGAIKRAVMTAHLGMPFGLRIFEDQSFDVVIAFDILEHLLERDGHELLEHVERIARKRVLLITPDGFAPQDGIDAWGFGPNEMQRHLSGWPREKLEAMGYVHFVEVHEQAGHKGMGLVKELAC